MNNKKFWICLVISISAILLIVYLATRKTDEDFVVGKWNWYNSDDVIDFSITCNEDHTGEYYLYGQTYPMDWHISDGIIYLDVRDENGKVTIIEYTYKSSGVVLVLEGDNGKIRLYQDGHPRSAVEGVEQADTMEHTWW